jgi:hypothetical protein
VTVGEQVESVLINLNSQVCTLEASGREEGEQAADIDNESKLELH